MKITNILRILTVIFCLVLGACRTATKIEPGVSNSSLMKPDDYIVVYLSDDGRAHPDPAVLVIDSTRTQEIFFIAQGTNLNVSFNDADQFKVRCEGKRCTAKVTAKQQMNLFDYKYDVEWTDRQGVRRRVDPVVIIDEIGLTLTLSP